MRIFLPVILVFVFKICSAQIPARIGRIDSSKTKITLRCSATASSSSGPLYMLDGLIISSLDLISPDSIESISVLRQSVSSAIFGIDGINGVIIIESKRATRERTKVLKEVVVSGTYCIRRRHLICCGGHTTICKMIGKTKTDTLKRTSSPKPDINIYPNPVAENSMINIQFDDAATGMYCVQLFSSSGSEVQQSNFSIGQKNIVSQLQLKPTINSGTYFLRIINNSSKIIHTEKLVVL